MLSSKNFNLNKWEENQVNMSVTVLFSCYCASASAESENDSGPSSANKNKTPVTLYRSGPVRSPQIGINGHVLYASRSVLHENDTDTTSVIDPYTFFDSFACVVVVRSFEQN